MANIESDYVEEKKQREEPVKYKKGFQGDLRFKAYRIGHVLRRENEVVGRRYTPAEF
jgi:hypothetical protein